MYVVVLECMGILVWMSVQLVKFRCVGCTVGVKSPATPQVIPSIVTCKFVWTCYFVQIRSTGARVFVAENMYVVSCRM